MKSVGTIEDGTGLWYFPNLDATNSSGFTGFPGGDVVNHLPADYLSVYIPTTPNPTGGYFVMLKKAECIELKMSVDEALTYVISMGVVVPAARPAPPLNPPL